MPDLKKAKIVVADDEESVRWTLKKALERSGYTVLTVADGQAAVETADRVGADLVLMDIKMPTVDGLQALSQLRERHPEIMVVVMTAFGSLQAAVEGGRATKPGLKIGICGEHGGDPRSVAFCHRVGLNYVSCSPFRVPIARLAAAQAALAEA